MRTARPRSLEGRSARCRASSCRRCSRPRELVACAHKASAPRHGADRGDGARVDRGRRGARGVVGRRTVCWVGETGMWSVSGRVWGILYECFLSATLRRDETARRVPPTSRRSRAKRSSPPTRRWPNWTTPPTHRPPAHVSFACCA